MDYSYRIEDSFIGKIITIDNGKIEFSVSLDVGPRIISLKVKGGFNLLYEDKEDSINKDCSSIYGNVEKWHIYGGHRLWLSPENISTYYPDNNKISYELTENGIIVYPNKWKIIDVQPQILIEFTGENNLKITHKMRNLGAKRKLCLWSLTAMKAGGEMTFYLSKEDTGYLANRNIVLWSYDDINDERFNLKNDRITAKSYVNKENPFKVGAFSENIHVEYVLEKEGKKCHFIKETVGKTDETYPDYNCNFECYFNDKIHELETLSHIQEVEKNEIIEHIENWQIF
jgi:hypothetical protein